MSNIQTGAERMPHDLSHLGFLAGQIGRLITISTTPVIAGDSFEMDARSEERFSRNAETDIVCRLLLEKKNKLTRNPLRNNRRELISLPGREFSHKHFRPVDFTIPS